MRARGRAQAVRELDRARHAGAEADAVVRPVDIVVHRFRYGDDIHAFVVQSLAVAERVVAADGDQHVDPDVLQVLQYVPRDVVDLVRVSAEMRRHAFTRQMARARA